MLEIYFFFVKMSGDFVSGSEVKRMSLGWT